MSNNIPSGLHCPWSYCSNAYRIIEVEVDKEKKEIKYRCLSCGKTFKIPYIEALISY